MANDKQEISVQPVLCKACGKQVPDATREAAYQQGAATVYCSYECYCDD
jgi:hypothetical protein